MKSRLRKFLKTFKFSLYSLQLFLFNIFLFLVFFYFSSMIKTDVRHKLIDSLSVFYRYDNFNVISIFLNNFILCLFIVGGGYLFCIPSFLIYGINVVFIASMMFENQLKLITILPHSFFEFIAILYSLILAEIISSNYFSKYKKRIHLKTHFSFIGIILIIASILEVFV